MILKSPVFENNQNIPVKYTCDGEDINPPLQISEVPEGTQSLALIMEDPDVPKNLRADGLWTHWLVWNIDPKTSEITENSVPAGATEGTTTYGKPGWGGPCPPSGTHRYFFKLYALDTKLVLSSSSDKRELEEVMANHIGAQAELIGLYSRQ